MSRQSEGLARATTVFLDKTGTITEGAFEVDGVEAIVGDSDEVLRLAASLERHSIHPLASAVVAAARERNLDLLAVEGVHEEGGLGLEADGLVRVGPERSVPQRDSLRTEASEPQPQIDVPASLGAVHQLYRVAVLECLEGVEPRSQVEPRWTARGGRAWPLRACQATPAER